MILTYKPLAPNVQEEPRRLGKAQGWLPVPARGQRQRHCHDRLTFEVCEMWFSLALPSGVLSPHWKEALSDLQAS